MALPSSIGCIALYRSQVAESPIFAEVLPGTTEDGKLNFNARVVDGEGDLYLELEDYGTAPLSNAVEQDLLVLIRLLL